jgi:scyllo-inositol 2-dehydrogenase (NADP+)
MGRDTIRCAIVGYGTTFHWGWIHAAWIKAVAGLELGAICTRTEESAARARHENPGVETCTDLAALLRRADIDLVTILTPHNTHADLTVQCLEAGKHVLVDKAMALTVDECDRMIDAAERNGRALAVFHNRRHDGNIRAITEVVRSGEIGEVFYAEFYAGGYAPPGPGWYDDQAVSGGALYTYGPHVIDWLRQWIPGRPVEVTGIAHKLVWRQSTNADHAQGLIRFANGAAASITTSRIAYLGKPQWHILGTRGAIIDTAEGALTGYTREIDGLSAGSFRLKTAAGERQVPYKDSDWSTYYRDLAAHLRGGAPVPVSAEEGRATIAVLEAIERSAVSGRSETVQET